MSGLRRLVEAANAQRSGTYASARTAKVQLVQVVGSRPNTYFNGLSGGTAPETFRSKHMALANITSLRLMYGNFYGTSSGPSGDGPGDLVVACSVEYPLGTIIRGFFLGARQATIKGGGTVLTDEIPVTIPKGTPFYVRTAVISGNWPQGVQGNFALVKGIDTVGDGVTTDSNEGDNGAGGGDASASGTITSRFNNLYSPMALLGTSTDGTLPCVAAVGDSIINYNNDYDSMGYLYRAVNNTMPLIKASQGGERANQFVVLGGSLVEGRLRLLKYATHAIEAYGRNDFTAVRTAAQVEADRIAIWNYLGRLGIKTWATTTTPRTTSTDGWATTGAQTISPSGSEADRVAQNGWLRDGAPIVSGAAVAVGTVGAARCNVYDSTGALVTAASGPTHPLQGVLEMADLCESARNSGLWKVTGRTVTDAAATASSGTITSATAAFVAGDVGKSLYIVGAGSGGADFAAFIKSVTNSTTAVATSNAATTVSGARMVIGGATTDGTHPAPHIHAAMAALVPVASFTV